VTEVSTVRVLVTYGSRNGGTAEIAGWIADELRAQCLVDDEQFDRAPQEQRQAGHGRAAGGEVD